MLKHCNICGFLYLSDICTNFHPTGPATPDSPPLLKSDSQRDERKQRIWEAVLAVGRR